MIIASVRTGDGPLKGGMPCVSPAPFIYLLLGSTISSVSGTLVEKRYIVIKKGFLPTSFPLWDCAYRRVRGNP